MSFRTLWLRVSGFVLEGFEVYGSGLCARGFGGDEFWACVLSGVRNLGFEALLV